MSSLKTKGFPTSAPPRRTVRIVKRRLPTRAAALSLAAVAATAVFALASWGWWRSDRVEPVPAPNLLETEIDWRCAGGHEFASPGQPGSRPCPICAETSFPTAMYQCDKHGSYAVLVEFEVRPDGSTPVTKYRVQGGLWATADSGPRCPRCGAALTRSEDPLAGTPKSRRRSGG